MWIVPVSTLFFGTITVTIKSCFLQPLNRPAKRGLSIPLNTILEQLDGLSVEELDLLKQPAELLINHMERVKAAQFKSGD